MACLKPLVEALGALFRPDLEVVLHDLRHPRSSIVAIANGHVTHRRVGSGIIGRGLHEARSGPRMPGERTKILLGFPTRTRDGRELRSTSIVYYSAATGRPIVSLGLNYDLTRLQTAQAALDGLVRSVSSSAATAGPAPNGTAPLDVEGLIANAVREVVATSGKPVALMTKTDRVRVVEALEDAHVFMTRKAVERVARALGVSRFTIYHYLRERRTMR